MKLLYIICLFSLTAAFIKNKYLLNKYSIDTNLNLFISDSLYSENNTKKTDEKIPEYVFYLSSYDYSKYLNKNLNNMSGNDMHISENSLENAYQLEKIIRNSILFSLLKSLETNDSEINKIEELNMNSYLLNNSLLNNIGLKDNIKPLNICSGGLFDKWNNEIDF
jgi:hypothetical protein